MNLIWSELLSLRLVSCQDYLQTTIIKLSIPSLRNSSFAGFESGDLDVNHLLDSPEPRSPVI